MIGIIDYETAKWLYGNFSKQQDYFSLSIPFAGSKFLIEDLDVHKAHIKNTMEYLKNEPVHYNYNAYFDHNKFYSGVNFKIKYKNE